jgi:tetratricopeptide (TPR) repeat protein
MAPLFVINDREKTSLALYREATAAYLEDDFALAAKLYRTAFNMDPGNVQALIMLGCCHYKLDDITTATGLFHEAIERAPFDPAAHYYLGMCRAQAGEYRRAVLSYQRALANAPTFFECWLALSLAYDRLDMPAESREAMVAFDAHAPSDVKRKVLQMVGL